MAERQALARSGQVAAIVQGRTNLLDFDVNVNVTLASLVQGSNECRANPSRP
jgi:hypothetical protein